MYISVIIPFYNSDKYINECLSSILSQKGDFHISEIIIVDDASTERNVLNKTIHDWCSNIKLTVMPNTGLKGAAGARNTGLRAAISEWIIFLDADDVLTDDSINERVKLSKTYPQCGWIAGDLIIWNEDGSLEKSGFLKSRNRTYKVLHKAFELNHPILYERPVTQFISVCLTQVGVSLLKKELIDTIGGFREHLRQAEDYQFWIRLAAISDFVFVPKLLMFYRQHGTSTMAQDLAPRLWTVQAFEELLNENNFSLYKPQIESRLAEFHFENSFYFRKKKLKHEALNSLTKSFLLKPNFNKILLMIVTVFK